MFVKVRRCGSYSYDSAGETKTLTRYNSCKHGLYSMIITARKLLEWKTYLEFYGWSYLIEYKIRLATAHFKWWWAKIVFNFVRNVGNFPVVASVRFASEICFWCDHQVRNSFRVRIIQTPHACEEYFVGTVITWNTPVKDTIRINCRLLYYILKRFSEGVLNLFFFF
jgi:hypothetical protein